MLRGKLPTNVKAIIGVHNGFRIEGEALTRQMLEYALNNRSDFNFVYKGDVIQAPEEEAQEPPMDPTPKFSKSDLLMMNSGALMDLCDSYGIILEGNPDNDEMADMILAEQEAR